MLNNCGSAVVGDDVVALGQIDNLQSSMMIGNVLEGGISDASIDVNKFTDNHSMEKL